MVLFSNTISLLEKSLDYSSLKQKVTSQNIANSDTPNYKSKKVDFKSILNDEKNKSITAYRTHIKHIPFQTQPTNLKVISQDESNFNHNGNSVDVDKEMAEMAEHQIYYNALIERINGKFRTLETVVRGGK